MRVIAILAATGLLWLGLIGSTTATDDSGLKRPLDLPSTGAGDDEEDEDAPESITFFGAEYEGDGFFWCLDRSGSMVWGGRISTLKTECTQTINQLSTRAEFSLVSFSTNHTVWSPSPKKASSSNKAAAIAWVNGLIAEGWTCLAPAGVQTLQIANQSNRRRRQVLILGDGVPVCGGNDTTNECLTQITGANYENIPINTLFISTSSEGVTFFTQLAQMNGGSFTHVQN